MKIKAKLKYVEDKGYETQLTFATTMLREVPKKGDYEITEIGTSRSLNQNAMLWGLINQICRVEDGDEKGRDEKYLQLLEMSGAKTTLVSMPVEAVEQFKALVRHIRVLDTYEEGEKQMATVEVFYGSSTFNTKEMTNLIDTTIWYASQLGIDTEYFKNQMETKNENNTNKHNSRLLKE